MTRHNTFVFADIAGYTALTEAHGDDSAADLALEFCRRTRERLRPSEGSVVKTIGDALMIRMNAAAPAVHLGLEVVHELMSEHGRPTARVGMLCGPATEREGDFFGATVNLAARIAAAAAGGDVLVSESVRACAGEHADLRFVSLGSRRLRNLRAPVELFAVHREQVRPAATWTIDPVCRMIVTPGREARQIAHQGARHLFCSEGCAELFASAPEDFGAASPDATPRR